MCKTRLDTKIHPRRKPEDAKFEEKRGVIIGPAVDAGAGATRRRESGTVGGAKIRGDPEIHQRHRRRVRNSRRLGDPPDGAAEGTKIRGDPENRRRHCRKMWNPGRPGDSSQGETGRHEIRGNSKIRQTVALKRIGDSRQLDDPSPAKPGDAGGGETRSLTSRLMGRCMVQVTCEVTIIETPETPVSGVFVFRDRGVGRSPMSLHGPAMKLRAILLLV